MAELPDAGALAPLIGEWTVTAEFPSPDLPVMHGRTTFEWLLGRRYVLQRTAMDHPEAPSSHCVLVPNTARPGGFVQHYFDSRGVVRLYEMTFDGGGWTLLRTAPDFSPLDFAQRFTATLSGDGDTLPGRWETSTDGNDWQLDFELTCRRAT